MCEISEAIEKLELLRRQTSGDIDWHCQTEPVKQYVAFLESEVERLRYFSPYQEDNPDLDQPYPEQTANQMLFRT